MSPRIRGRDVAPGDEGFPFPPWQRPVAAQASSPKQPLSRVRIIEVALRIIDAEGTEAVSMRRIATELDTGAASLYAHVSGKDEVLQMAHEYVLGEIELPETDGRGWEEVLRDWAWEVYRVYGRHQDIARLSLADIPTGPRSLDLTELLLRTMIDDGVPNQVAAWALDRMSQYIGADAFEGWLMSRKIAARSAGNTGPTEGSAEAKEWFEGIRDYFKTLPRDRFPTLVDNLSMLMTGDGRRRFEVGLDMLIGGISAMAARESGAGGRESGADARG